MPFIDLAARRARRLAGAVLLAGVGACSVPPPVPPKPQPVPTPTTPTARAPAPSATPATPAPPATAAPSTLPVPLPPPRAAGNWDEFRLQAAQRLVQAQPAAAYLGAVPEPLLAIPVLEIELDADGGVRKVTVTRYPSQARDTAQLAIAAVHRAAPYGSMRRLPRPWKWTEVFLFDDDRRFKPRTLDLD